MNQNNTNRPNRRRHDIAVYIMLIISIIAVVLLFQEFTKPETKKFTYNEFTVELDNNTLSKIQAKPAGGENYTIYVVTGTYTETINEAGDTKNYKFSVNVTQEQLNEVIANGAEINLGTISESIWLSILYNFLPVVLLGGIVIFIILRTSSGNSKAFDFGKSRARLSRDKNVTFKDVAGADEEKEELAEVIDFLKNPKKYAEMGARIPKGMLLVGPPGTGKTLLAKAVAGEANVPFFSISGSDFVEMFVGVGASRVRDLFKTAKTCAPCMIFIDEIDAVGRQRGAGMGGGHDEREQTLNQLLVEMDGFTANLGIIVIAATNRPDVLDPALLRPGRFDRQITINTPDVKGREAILKVHARNKKLEENVKLNELAQRIPGFSGADIENLLNEAALLAARQNRKVISMEDLDEATDRVMMGPAKRSSVITPKEKNLIAHHEAGHAVIGLKLNNAHIVQKVTIIPRGRAGGYALMLPEEETYYNTKKSLMDTITGYLGGRVAEEIIFNEVSTGARNDLERSTKIARSMVTEYGMSDLGPVQYEQPQGNVFLGRDYLNEKNFSDQIALEIDRETRKIIDECYEIARKVIIENKELLLNIATSLIEFETLTRFDIEEIEKNGPLKRKTIEKQKPTDGEVSH